MPVYRPIQPAEYDTLPEFVKSTSLDFLEASYSSMHDAASGLVRDNVCSPDECIFTMESLE